jgi:hypothetical protein
MIRALALALFLLVPTLAIAQTSSSARLEEAIKAACPSVTGLSIGTEGVAATVTVTPSNQQACAQATINAFDWGASAQTAWENLKLRAAAKALFATIEREGKALRCFALATKDEVNVLRAWLAAFKVEVDAAATLANLKTRVATLPATPARTDLQLRNAIDACIDGGTQD